MVGSFEDLHRFSGIAAISWLEAGDNNSLKSKGRDPVTGNRTRVLLLRKPRALTTIHHRCSYLCIWCRSIICTPYCVTMYALDIRDISTELCMYRQTFQILADLSGLGIKMTANNFCWEYIYIVDVKYIPYV